MRTQLVTTLKRHATEILNQLEKDREPILITQHGVASTLELHLDRVSTGSVSDLVRDQPANQH